MMPEDPYAYVEAAMQEPPPPDFVPEPVYLEFMPLEDDVLPVEEQPLLAAISPTAESPGYITEDEEEEESSRDDADDEEEDEDKDEGEDEEKERLAPADFVSPPTYRTTARMSIPSLPIPASPTYPLGYRAAMIRLRAESPYSFHPLPLPPPIVLPYIRASIFMMRAAAPSTYILAPLLETAPSGTQPLLPIPLPTSSPSLLLPSTDCKADVLAVTLPSRKRPTGGFRVDYGFVGTLDAEIRCDLDREIGYGITDVWEDRDEIAEEIPATDVAKLSQRMTDFVTTVRQDIDKIYVRLDDVQDDRLLMSVLAHQTKIEELRAAERRRQTQLTEALTMLRTLQTQMVSLQSQQTPVRGRAHPDKMAPIRRTTMASPATTTTTTPITNAQLKALIDQGVANALAARDTNRSRNGNDSHNSGTGSRRTERTAHECTYTDFLKCQPINFKGTKRVELALMYRRMFLEESDKIAKYVRGLPDMIHGNVMASKSKTMQDAVEFATKLMDKKIVLLLNVRLGIKGSLRTLQGTIITNNNKRRGRTLAGLTLLGLVRRDLTKDLNLCALNATITMMVYVLLNAISATQLAIWPVIVGVLQMPILLTTKGALGLVRKLLALSAKPKDISRGNHYYDVELADGRIVGLNTIIQGCTLNFLNHPFNIDLMPVELGIFDVIIGMDWLTKYQAVIVCVEKIIRIPWGNKTLIVRGDGSNRGNETRLNIISCTKTQKYMLKGCHIFFTHVTTKKTEDKSEGKRLEDVPIVQDFPEVFNKDFSSLPPTRQVEFQIDLMSGAAPAARAPYRLAPSEMKEFSDQLHELFDKGFIRPSSSPWGARSCLSRRRIDPFDCAFVEGVETTIAPTTAEEKAQRRLELKARSTLLMGIPNEHQLKFNSIKDAKSLLQAVEKSSEVLDQTFDRIQKLTGQLEIHGESILQKDANQKFLRSLSPEWNTHTIVWRNKHAIDTLSLDDLYNNMKIYEQEMAMLTMRVRRFLKNTRRKFSMNGNKTIGFDKSKVECYNCHKRGHFAKECKALRSQDTKHKESTRRIVPMETPNSAALVSCDVPPPYTGNFMPSKPDLSFFGLKEFVSEPIVSKSAVKKLVVETSEAKASADKPKVARKNFGSSLIEDWISDSEDEAESKPKIKKKIVKPSFAKIEFVKFKEQVKSPRNTTVKQGKGFSGSKTPLFPIMMVQAQEEMGEGSANPTDPHHALTIIQPPTSQPQRNQKLRKTNRKDTELPQTSGPTTNVADEAVNEEMNDSLVRAATTASSLEAERDSGELMTSPGVPSNFDDGNAALL
nr:putative reverse transcriptase domain-containing protein [Tanacetum cinerariifolium]